MRLFSFCVAGFLILAPGLARAEPAAVSWRAMPVIALDLSGDRKFALRPADGKSGVYFDRDSDGRAEYGDWLGAEDGFLVLDQDGDGRISDGRELLIRDGHDGRYGLALADYNNDGRLDARDGLLWERLRVWRDLDQNGRSLPEEIYTLESLGIAWIDVAAARGRFSRTVNGKRQVRAATILELRYDPGRTIRISHEERAYLAEKLPELPQMNKVPGLRAVMALDNDGSNSAFALTQKLVSLKLPELFTRAGRALAEEIILRRAGIDQSARAYFGPLIDARRVVFPVLLAGRDVPARRAFGFWEAYEAERLYEKIRAEQAARLWLQAAGAALFAGPDPSYDPVRGNLRAVRALDPAQVASLRARAEALGPQEREDYWRAVVAFVDYVLGFENLGRDDYALLAEAAGGRDFDFEKLVRAAVRLAPYDIAAAAQGERYVGALDESKQTLRSLLEGVRRQAGDADVNVTTLVTRHIHTCCKDLQEIMSILRRSGFEVADVSDRLQAQDHPLRNFGYVRALRAVATGASAKGGGKADRYEIILYFNADGFEWAQAEMGRR